LRQVPARAAPARDQTRDRPSPVRARLRPGPLPLGRRADLRVAAPVQTAARPLRPPPRHARCVAADRLLPRLLQTTPELILRRALRTRFTNEVCAAGSCVLASHSPIATRRRASL